MKNVLIALFLILMTNLQTFAAYNVHLGQSIFLRDNKLDLSQVSWVSDDSSVASVSKDGVALALKKGKTKVKALKNGQVIASYDLNILDPEGIKYLYTEPNLPLCNSKITLFAITNKDVSKVKFNITVNNNTSSIISNKKVIDGDNYIYYADFNLPACNNFFINASYYRNGSFKKTSINKKITTLNQRSFSDTSLDTRRLSKDGINFITSYEGFKSEISKDTVSSKDIFDIGYGDVINFRETFYNKITRKEAYAKLLERINNLSCANAVNRFLISNNIMFNKHQFDALVSFTYNLGTAWMRNSDLKNIILSCKNLNNIDKDKFINKILCYHHCGKKCIKGLLYRRIDELEIFFFNDYNRDGNLNKHKFSIPSCITNAYGNFI